jgi:hypothetical protein
MQCLHIALATLAAVHTESEAQETEQIHPYIYQECHAVIPF